MYCYDQLKALDGPLCALLRHDHALTSPGSTSGFSTSLPAADTVTNMPKTTARQHSARQEPAIALDRLVMR